LFYQHRFAWQTLPYFWLPGQQAFIGATKEEWADMSKQLSLINMHEAEFPALWKAALEVAHGNSRIALSTIVRMVRRHIEVAANERERRLTEGET
jgi:hypothetical protein